MNKEALKNLCLNAVEIIEKAERYDSLFKSDEELIILPKSKLIEKIEFRTKNSEWFIDDPLKCYASISGKLVLGYFMKIENYKIVEDIPLELQQKAKETIIDNIVSQLGGKYLK